MNILLWIVQILLALLFLFAGVTKLLPGAAAQMSAAPGPVHLSALLLQFIGACEVLGGLGLVLPGLFRIRQNLTVLAAIGLLIIMIGAVVLTISGGLAMVIIPIVTGLLCAFVAYGRGVKHW